ncbi:MAG TPA: hypothetical protein VKQ72_22850 [Aggregatilineales bacterium]|nr:hypothetical protein [Aggregatilineales bacterium]
MRSQDKVPALGIVWGVFLVLAFFSLLRGPMGFWDAVWGITLVLATFGVSAFIMGVHRADAEPGYSDRDTHSQGKAKHSDLALVERLVESMSDEELAALRQRLTDQHMSVGDDGEMIPGEYRDSQRRSR